MSSNEMSGIKPIGAQFGIDIEDQLTSLLSEEIARSIDRDVLIGLGIEPDRNKRRSNSINKITDKIKSSEL